MKSVDRDFLLLDGLPAWARWLGNALLLSLVLVLQLFLGTAGAVAGGVLLLAFILFNWVRKVTIPKEFFSGDKDWKPATIEGFRRALAKLGRIRHTVNAAASGVAYLVFVVVLGIMSIPLWEMTRFRLETVYVVVDLLVVGFVAFSSGNRYIWSPAAFKIKLPLLISTHRFINERWPKRYRLEPQFLVEMKDNQYLPMDAKLMVHRREGNPTDLYGLQFAVAVNSVQNSKYPYFYGVIAAQGRYPLKQGLERFWKERRPPKEETHSLIIAHEQQPKDVHIIIVRQNTGRSRGYHTPEKAVKRITRVALSIFDSLETS